MKIFPLSILGLVACLLAGCGGGGGGSSTPRATATPVPTTADACNANNYTPNYASSIERLQRWRGFPLRVFLKPTNARTRALTLRGFNQWVDATDNRVRFNVVDNADNADITVAFAQIAPGDDTLGVTTTSFFRGSNFIESATIQFNYYPFDSRPDAEETNQSVAAHEFGHALGIGGHSPDENDLMFAFATGGQEEVTNRDLNTLRTSYCDDFPTRNSNAIRKPGGILESFTISHTRNGCKHHKH